MSKFPELSPVCGAAARSRFVLGRRDPSQMADVRTAGRGAGWAYGPGNEGRASMTGGFWAPIVIPIVAALALALWIAVVYYADARPGWRNQPRRPQQHITGIRDPIEPVEKREREPAGTTPGAGAAPDQAGATAPRPRTPSESEQLERQAGERRLRRGGGFRLRGGGGSCSASSGVTRNMSRWLRHGTVSSAASASPRDVSTRGSARLGAGWRGTASIRGIARPRRARSTGP